MLANYINLIIRDVLWLIKACHMLLTVVEWMSIILPKINQINLVHLKNQLYKNNEAIIALKIIKNLRTIQASEYSQHISKSL